MPNNKARSNGEPYRSCLPFHLFTKQTRNHMISMKQDFRAYAVHHHRIGSQYVDGFINRMEHRFIPTAMTPYITEERQLNVAQMDVFSRLMMDRIIFLGDAVDDKIANIIQAQLLFLQSADAKRVLWRGLRPLRRALGQA